VKKETDSILVITSKKNIEGIEYSMSYFSSCIFNDSRIQ